MCSSNDFIFLIPDFIEFFVVFQQVGIERILYRLDGPQNRMFIVIGQTQNPGQQLKLNTIRNTIVIEIPCVEIMELDEVIPNIDLRNSIRNSASANGHGCDAPFVEEFGAGIGSSRNP